MTEDYKKKVSYCVGMSLAHSLIEQNLGDISVDEAARAMRDIFEHESLDYTFDQASKIISDHIQKIHEGQHGINRVNGEQFLKENAKKDSVTTTLSGLQYEVMKEGEGTSPSSNAQVTVHYHGTLIDGTVFDSSIQRGQPATFGVNQVIKGWTEALQLMKKGSKYRLYIPQELAYGATSPSAKIRPYSTLIFDVELIDF